MESFLIKNKEQLLLSKSRIRTNNNNLGLNCYDWTLFWIVTTHAPFCDSYSALHPLNRTINLNLTR